MASADAGTGAPSGPVLFAYDGSELAELGIEQAGRQLAHGRDALVVCVWQTGTSEPMRSFFSPQALRHDDWAFREETWRM